MPANNSKPASIATPEKTAAPDQMYAITLNKSVSVHGYLFKPGQLITVDEATRAAMGDAVVDAKPV